MCDLIWVLYLQRLRGPCHPVCGAGGGAAGLGCGIAGIRWSLIGGRASRRRPRRLLLRAQRRPLLQLRSHLHRRGHRRCDAELCHGESQNHQNLIASYRPHSAFILQYSLPSEALTMEKRCSLSLFFCKKVAYSSSVLICFV